MIEEEQKISFLSRFMRIFGENAYDILRGIEAKRIGLLYTMVLFLFLILSQFVRWSLVCFGIDCMMGFTILSIPYLGVLIVACDIQIIVPEHEKFEDIKKTSHYKWTKVWGIFLLLFGLTMLYFSGRYKRHYDFQCQDFYLGNQEYHILENCEYLKGMDVKEVNGYDLETTYPDYSLCSYCNDVGEAEVWEPRHLRR